MIVRDLGEVAAESALARADDAPANTDAVRVGDGGRAVEGRPEPRDLLLEVRVERQLLRDDERRDEDDVRAAVGREPAREVDRVVGLGTPEERDDDAPVADRRGPPCEAARPSVRAAEIGPLHRMTWYGTLARITSGSKRRSRLM